MDFLFKTPVNTNLQPESFVWFFSSANETNKLKVSLHFSNVHQKKTELKNKQNQYRIAVI